MDPLSITVGALSIFDAAVKVAKAVQHLKDTKGLPAEFASLVAEVADLQHVLQQCDKTCQQHEHILTATDGHDVQKHGHTAKVKLEELLHHLTAHSRPAGRRNLAGYWTDVVHGKTRLSRSRDELRDIRLGLLASLQVACS